MGAWIKKFRDESIEVGSDIDIEAGKASWSKGRLDDISNVYLYDGLSGASLSFPKTNWHQFDRYTVNLGEKTRPSRIFRAIQSLIKKEYLDKYICYNCSNIRFIWACIEDSPDEYISYIKIKPEYIGMWFTSLISNTNKPQLFLTDKGKFYGGKQLSISK